MAEQNEHAFRLRKDLDQPIPPPEWPPGISWRTLLSDDAQTVYEVMSKAFDDGRGVPTFDLWWPNFSADPEFDPSLCFLVSGKGGLAGVALCWRSAFVKDLAVDPAMQRRGIGGNLLKLVFRTFRARGASHVDLKVEANNTSAIRLYEKAGMYRVPWDG